MAIHCATKLAVAILAAISAVSPVAAGAAFRSASIKAVQQTAEGGVAERSIAGEQRRTVPGWGGPTWGGRSFSDSIVAFNPWTKVRTAPVIQNLKPIAPLDRVDQSSNLFGSITGAAPLAPTDEAHSLGYTPALQSDYVAPDKYPHTFPADRHYDSEEEDNSPLIPIADRHLIASADKLRPSYAWRSSGNYPLVAPADRIISSGQKMLGWLGAPHETQPWPVGSADYVKEKFARYFEQVHNDEQQRQADAQLREAYNAADRDKDGTVSRDEYDLLLMDGQNKTHEEAERLWGRYHTSKGAGLSRAEFRRLAHDGFDLGAISRSDISSVISLPGAPHKGFWGSGAKCPHDSYVTGAKLKIMPLAEHQDDTALNAVGLRCSDGTEVNTVEGPNGGWTEWAMCPEGQWVFSARARSHPYKKGQDNTALATLELGCRRPDLGAMARLRFVAEEPKKERKNVVTGVGPVAEGGGWTKEFMCGSKAAVCGAQAHVVRDQGAGDDMGLADLRLYCCSVPVDCSEACGPRRGPGSVQCQVCQIAAGMKKADAGLATSGGIKGRKRPSQEDFQGGRRRRSVIMPPLPSEIVPLPSQLLPLAATR